MIQPAPLSIGEVANQVGIRPSAIRFYEQAGLLTAPPRLNGRRVYQAAIVKQIRLIQMAQHAGFSVGEIRTLFHEFPTETPPSERWQTLASLKIEEIDQLIMRLNTMKTVLHRAMQCECPTLEDCANGLEAVPGQ